MQNQKPFCLNCGSTNIYKNGHDKYDNQQYFCFVKFRCRSCRTENIEQTIGLTTDRLSVYGTVKIIYENINHIVANLDKLIDVN
ncbi:hypothetical protein SAMN04488510_10132 [Fervidobacterium changbaicum]|uniref:hypothetical protein n=1 Tax=Fervidobacterium changbaicum TaxID=310769 RepID=UPI00088FE910|nr:hypothetical protein [Fervidobacterium changbaicum]SDG89469.1 hypothetical protein SAMN04488510_10132 [Fervidobacterium changbaicum]